MIKILKCSVCGAEFREDQEEQCRKCEESHLKPSEIIGGYWGKHRPYPAYIRVKFPDGESVLYEREGK